MIAQNIVSIQRRIDAVCAANGRKKGSVRLIAVTKGRSVEDIRQVLSAGVRDIAESKVQEALLKYKELTAAGQICSPECPPSRREPSSVDCGPSSASCGLSSTHHGPSSVDCGLLNSTITWHMIGHLQTNKAKEAVRIFDLIHSVDSIKLAQEIDKQAARIGKVQDILIEVKTSEEESKFGISARSAETLVKLAGKLPNIRLRGFMTMAPYMSDPRDARPYFRKLREARDSFNADISVACEMSMGMSADFEAAIAEGGTMVRIGSALFE